MNLKTRVLFTGIVTILICLHLSWDYFHGGVPTHYLLQSKDMPGISNWWGGIALPLFTWILLYRIQQRMKHNSREGLADDLVKVAYKFFALLVFGIILSVFFTIGSDAPGYLMIGLILLSFFVPLYQAEYLLGYVLGMTYTFGAILPIGFSLILTIIYIVAYKLIRTGALYLVAKI